MRVAVVGSGISGLGAGWLLAEQNDVVVYEAAAVPGGHARTLDLLLDEGSVPVDVGFIVYNVRNYPNLMGLFDHLKVPTKASDMSFSISVDHGRLEYEGSAGGLFAQPANLARPRHWRLLKNILRFYREAPKVLTRPDRGRLTLRQLIAEGGYGQDFAEHHILPMGAAIWSSSFEQMLDFPAESFVRFFVNHGLFDLGKRPQWRTVTDGSREYVRRVCARFGANLRLNCPVVRVDRDLDGVTVIDGQGQRDRFDQVILATHADQTLSILGRGATPLERDVLGSFSYQPNRAWVHLDRALMPKTRRAWASWNHLDQGRDRIAVTYWMNRLQGLPTKQDVFVTLNPLNAPRGDLLQAELNYRHPQFDLTALAAQQRLPLVQGVNRTWMCGSYFGYGFHEDGLQSGVAVAPRTWCRDSLGTRRRHLWPGGTGCDSRTIGDGGSMTVSCLYRGRVMHRRLRPFNHRFSYRIFSLYLDLDEVPALDRSTGLFAYNRWGLLSFHDRDHGPRDGSDLRAWIEARLAQEGLDLGGGAIRLLCFPRVLGFVFNPLTIWYCFRADGTLGAVLYEVRNTFGEAHGYLVPVQAAKPLLRQSCAKAFYVSPFLGMKGRYRFRLRQPDERLSILIRHFDPDGEVLVATQTGQRKAFSDRTMGAALLAMPLMTFKVVAAIHWQALKLWLKGARYHKHLGDATMRLGKHAG